MSLAQAVSNVSAADAGHQAGGPLDWYSEPDLLWIAAQIAKTTDLEWAGLSERSERLLSRTHEWVLLCVAVCATIHLHGADALPAALQRLRDAAESRWREMQPPATGRGLKRRGTALSWVIDGIADYISSEAGAATTEALRQASRELAGLDAVLNDKFREDGRDVYPGVSSLRRVLEQSIQVAPSPPQTPPAAPGGERDEQARAAVSVVDVAPDAAAGLPSITDAASADAALTRTREALFAVADALQQVDLTNPEHFRYRRAAAWLRIDALPVVDGDRLPIGGPPHGEDARLRSVLATDVNGVLHEAEAALCSFPLWLDANHLTWLALSRMGPAFALARHAVERETLGLIARLPQLLTVTFANGVPLASGGTADWLKAALAGVGPPEGSERQAAGDDVADAFDSIRRSADELATAGRLDESVALLADQIRTATCDRDRFRWRTIAARHMARHGRHDVAIDLLEGLECEAQALMLDRWEPDLCTAVISAILEIGATDIQERITREGLVALKRRLTRLDLRAAVRHAEGRQ